MKAIQIEAFGNPARGFLGARSVLRSEIVHSVQPSSPGLGDFSFYVPPSFYVPRSRLLLDFVGVDYGRDQTGKAILDFRAARRVIHFYSSPFTANQAAM